MDFFFFGRRCVPNCLSPARYNIFIWFHQLTSDLSDLDSADVLDVMNLNQKFCVLLRVNAFIWTQPVLMTVVYNMERGQRMNSGQFVASGLKFCGICTVFLYKTL